MSVSIRAMRSEDARRFLEIQRESVRGIAARDYPSAVIEAWAPLPVTDEAVARFLSNADHEIRLIAELDGRSAGIGALVLSNSELRACYVVPSAVRRGVGTAIVAEIERIARQYGLVYLQLESSLSAERFYTALGYRVKERGELTLASGVPMAAITMRKQLE
jgi:GNAT superfamily N-acetyltransferase